MRNAVQFVFPLYNLEDYKYYEITRQLTKKGTECLAWSTGKNANSSCILVDFRLEHFKLFELRLQHVHLVLLSGLTVDTRKKKTEDSVSAGRRLSL